MREEEARDRITEDDIKEWWGKRFDWMQGDFSDFLLPQTMKTGYHFDKEAFASAVLEVSGDIAKPLADFLADQHPENMRAKANALADALHEIAIKDILKTRFGLEVK